MTRPSVFWVEMNGLNLLQEQPTRSLSANRQVHSDRSSGTVAPPSHPSSWLPLATARLALGPGKGAVVAQMQ